MKRATKLWIAVAVILAGLSATAGSLASGEAGEQVAPPAEQIVRIAVDEEGTYRVYPGTLFVKNGEKIYFSNLTAYPAQLLVPRRSFWKQDGATLDGGGNLEIGAGDMEMITISSYHSAKGAFNYQIYIGGLPSVDTMESAKREALVRAWSDKPHGHPGYFAIGDSPPRMIVE